MGRRSSAVAAWLFRNAKVTVAATVLAAAASAANAATVTFTDRAAWSAAMGGANGGEDFDGFVADTSFLSAPVALADGMSIGVLFNDGDTSYNKIDVQPVSSEVDVNGTAAAKVFNGQSGAATSPWISFATTISAFGADFMNLNDDTLRSRIELYDGVTLVTTLTPSTEPSGTVRFFGFVSDTQISQIRFVRVENDVFGIDDIEIRTGAAVPLPPAALLGLGLLGGLGVATRLRKRRQTTIA